MLRPLLITKQNDLSANFFLCVQSFWEEKVCELQSMRIKMTESIMYVYVVGYAAKVFSFSYHIHQCKTGLTFILLSRNCFEHSSYSWLRY